MGEVKNKLKTRHYKYDTFLNKAAMSYVMPPQPTPKQQKCRKHLVRRLKKRGMFIIDPNHKGAGTYGLLAPHGKMYIGKSVEYRKRMQSHKSDAYNKKKNGKWKQNRYLYKAIRKWGWDRFEKFLFQKHDEMRADIDDVLNKQEVALIAEFETFTDQSKGYNLTAGGEGTSGHKHTPEQVAANTARVKKQWEDPEFKAKVSAAISDTMNSVEFKAAHSERSKKLWEDPEYRKKTSAAAKEAMNRPEEKAAKSERSKKMWADPEVKAAHSAATKAMWADPEYREKTTAAIKEANSRPEVKAKISAALKKSWASAKGTKWKNAIRKRCSMSVVSKMLISGKNPIKTYQLIYHTGQRVAAEDLHLLFGIKIDNSTIGKIIKAKKRTRSGFEFEKYTGAAGHPTPEQPIKRMRVTNI